MKLNQSVQKATAILRAAAARPAGETASGLARAVGLSNATALRIIHTLEDEGFLMRRPGDGRYVIGLDLVRLGREAAPGDLLRAASKGVLQRLAEQTRESVTLSVVRGRQALDVVLQIEPPHLIQAVDWVGRRYPLHASSSGKILLAAFEPARLERFLQGPLERLTPATITDPTELRRELDRVRERGHATVVDELEEGLASVSVPVSEGGGRLLGSINVTGPSFRFDAERRAQAVAKARAAATEIEGALGTVAAADGAP